MPREIDFYFDFSSPYAYLASTAIDGVAQKHGRAVRWRPYMLGVVYKSTGYHPLEQENKRRYMMHDVARCARAMGVPFAVPARFPEALLAASRAVYWIDDQDRRKAGEFAKAAFRAYWQDGSNLADPAIVADIAAAHGIAAGALRTALDDPAVKDRFRRETEAAIAAGIFGSPFILVDGEPFWGADRLEQVDRWLASGGW
jgi:2-hydroxychromene-2-carboxylate isomerase